MSLLHYICHFIIVSTYSYPIIFLLLLFPCYYCHLSWHVVFVVIFIPLHGHHSSISFFTHLLICLSLPSLTNALIIPSFIYIFPILPLKKLFYWDASIIIHHYQYIQYKFSSPQPYLSLPFLFQTNSLFASSD
jgi:hypothetical protein